jgi:hypothetical protein
MIGDVAKPVCAEFVETRAFFVGFRKKWRRPSTAHFMLNWKFFIL